MKNILLFLFISFTFSSMAQENFKWDLVTESTKTKEQLYSDTKMFIAEVWSSAQDVIQNDDKENGLILIKGVASQSLVYQLNDHLWKFSYTVKLYVKENKYRIVIDNVHCQSARCGLHQWPLMPVSDSYPESKGLNITGVNKKRYETLMTNLKHDLQTIVDVYITYMENTNNTDSDW